MGWDGWMASLTQWTWVWTSSGSWWWTGKPGVLSPWSHNELDTTEQLNWIESTRLFLGIWGFKRQNPLVKLSPVETFTCFSNEEGGKKTIAQGYIQLKPQLLKPVTPQAVSLEKLNHNFREWDSHLFPLPSIIKLCSFQWLQCAAKTENHCFKIRAPI